MNWIEQEIQKWYSWLDNVIDHSIVPCEIQIGKALSSTNGDPQAARQIIALQYVEDSLSEAMSSDDYWKSALRRFDELLTNSEIMAE